MTTDELTGNRVAIVGLACRFPGAPDADTFWRNLCDGVESISRFTDDELEPSPLFGPDARHRPGFVPACGVLDDADRFDHDLFGLSRREATLADPQQRVLTEVTWTALEDACVDPTRYPDRIALYAGAGVSDHLRTLAAHIGDDPASLYEAFSGATAESVAARIAYLLRLRGEAITVHTACSTGLAVVHLAAQSLLLGQCGVAVAGAVRLAVPQRTGYVSAEGMILSPDGHCRPFDADAAGTVSGNGAGAVVLKRLEDALADDDRIYAVLVGSAMNNDGHRGVGFTAPSVAGQADVISEAMAFAGVGGDRIDYVEAHGTGTALGDPIEIAALSRAFHASGASSEPNATVADPAPAGRTSNGSPPNESVPIGSVKANIGHLDAAAGMAGLIKVALMLRHGRIPPTPHFRRPNPAIDFDGDRFAVNTELRTWNGSFLHRASVSSFGIGGTNVHAVLEQAPTGDRTDGGNETGWSEPGRHHLITLSAHTPSALSAMAAELVERLERHPEALADVAHTRAIGRTELTYRRSVVAATAEELIDELTGADTDPDPAHPSPMVAFLFPGNGAAWHGMAAGLYGREPLFAEELDRVVAELEPHLGRHLMPVLTEGEGPIEPGDLAHAALFAVEYALAGFWQRLGVRPAAMLGHSFGECVAAAVAGWSAVSDAAAFAVQRGRLVAGLPAGRMLAVGLDERRLGDLLVRHGDPALALSAINGDGHCTVSGPPESVTALRERLTAAGHSSVELPVRYAFHSPAVNPILPDLETAGAEVGQGEPRIGMVSSLTGTWWTTNDGSGAYWARHLREPVRFAEGLETLTTVGCDSSSGDPEDLPPLLLLEVGADQALTQLTRAHLRGRAGRKTAAVPSLSRRGVSAESTTGTDHRILLTAVGRLWRAGVGVDWDTFFARRPGRPISLPTYPFEGSDCRLAPVPMPSVTMPSTPADAAGTEQAASGDETSPGLDPVERQVFAIWAERLGTDGFGVHDDFLELGGNSLIAAQVLARLREAFGLPIPLSALFEAPTVAGLAARIKQLQDPDLRAAADAAAQVLPPIRARDRDLPIPLSVVQERTLRMDAADPGNPALVMPIAVMLEGRLDIPSLSRAVGDVMARHETLRTTFHLDGSEWTAEIRPPAAIELVIEPLDDEPDPTARAEQLAREEAFTRFDLASSPIRVRLLRLASDRHVLLVSLHHVVADTGSMANLMGEVAVGYRGYLQGQEAESDPSTPVASAPPAALPPLAPLTIQYADFAGWQREILDSPATAGQLAYWRDQATGRPGRPSTSTGGLRGGRTPVAIPVPLTDRVEELRAGLGTTGFTVLLAAYSALIASETGTAEPMVGTVLGNRNLPELEPLIGYVAHAVPLCADLSDDPPFSTLVRRLHQRVLAAHDHPDVPYEALVAEADGADAATGAIAAGAAGTPARIFDGLFVLHSVLTTPQPVPGGTWRRWPVPDMPPMFGPTMSPLSLVLEETPEAGLDGALEYAAELFDPAAAVAIVQRFTTLLDDALRAPDSPISALCGFRPPVRPPRSGSIPTAATTVTVGPEAGRTGASDLGTPQLSLSYFANDEDALDGPKYRLLLEGAKLADRLGYTAIWTPERHFHPFGGLYPSPTAINAALATATDRIGLRAGSVVLPLHDPVRVAEEWSVIDNLSGGRVGVSFASGWHADDFVLMPDNYADRRDLMETGIDTVRRLWRGESVRRRNGVGDQAEVRIRPRPVQSELPFWVTAAGSPATFELAGKLGGHVLTNLMGQTLDGLAEKLAIYRQAWSDAGHQVRPDGRPGHVTLMLHAFVAERTDQAYALVREPLLAYFRSSIDIFRGITRSQGLQVDPKDLSESDLQALLEHGLEKYLHDGGLFGTVADCAPMLRRVWGIGADEVAALVDFGAPLDATLRSVELLAELNPPTMSHGADATGSPLEAGPLEPRAAVTGGIPLADRSRPLPLSYAQQRLWYLDQLIPGDISYINAEAVRMRGRLDVSAMRRALRELVDRHEVLRTTFRIEPGAGTPADAVQVIHPASDPVFDIPLDVTDIAGDTPRERRDEVDRLVRAAARQPFDLAAGPLLRAHLFRLDDTEHVLLICVHHIASDGWSAGVMLSELATLYVTFATFGSAAAAPLPPLTVQYADYAVWQRGRPADAVEADLAYWREKLADLPMLQLPLDRPRGAVQGADGARLPIRLDAELTTELHGFCRRLGITPYMALHAGLVTLLHRYSGQTDLAVGTAVAGRSAAQTEQLIGCFINSVVIRADLSGEPSFADVAAGVKRQVLEAIAHSEVSFERIVDELSIPRTLSHTPLFQAMTVMHNQPTPAVDLGDLELRRYTVESGTVKFDLTLEFTEDSSEIEGFWEFNTDLFDPETIRRMSRHLLMVLTAAVDDPDRPIRELDLLDEKETAELLRMSRAEPLPEPTLPAAEHRTVQAAFGAQAARTPDRVALGVPGAGADRSPTFRMLDERTNAIARGLLEAGVGGDGSGDGARDVARDRLVGLLVDDPIETVTAMLAVLKAGGAYVPIDRHAPDARRTALLAAADPIVTVDTATDLESLATGRSTAPLPPAGTETDPAYVIFTSGSTGDPKGVVVEHRNLLYSTRARSHRYGPAGSVLNLYHLAFDGSAGLTYHALLTGGTLWHPAPSGGEPPDPQDLAALIERQRIEMLDGIPAVYAQILAAADNRQLDSLRAAIVGGEECRPDLVAAHREALPNTELHNEYGPTETTIFSTAQQVAPVPGPPDLSAAVPASRVPIGRPIAGTAAYVLDERRRLAPSGAAGELCIGGPGVARSYWGDSELTAERFVPDPFEPDGRGRMYRTGDLVRWNGRGELEFLGRIDRQMKVRGFRADPTEIEAVLASHPEVEDAAVRPDEHPSSRLTGYLVLRADPADRGELLEKVRTHVAERLPSYLVPRQMVVLDALPRTRHGKLDVTALPDPRHATTAEKRRAPADPLERALASVFCSVLGRDEIGVDDDFFALGGDSIQVIVAVTQARREGIEVDVRRLYSNPTVARLAAVAGAASPNGGAPTDADDSAAGPVPLAPIQRWFTELDLPEPDHWNLAVDLELSESADVERLREAFGVVLRRHDALRMRYIRDGGRWQQHLAGDASGEMSADTVHCVSLADVPPDQHAERIEATALRLHTSIDLAAGRLLHVALIDRGPGLPQRLLLVGHHLVLDVVSLRIVAADLFDAYRQTSGGTGSLHLPLAPSYARAARRSTEYAGTEAGLAELDYWRSQRIDQAPRLPRDGDGTNTEDDTRTVRVELDADRTRTLLRDLPRQTGAGVQGALLTGLSTALAGWIGSDRVRLDVQRHGRDELLPGLDTSRTVGWFSGFHPVLLPVDPDASPTDRLAVVAEVLATVPNAGAGFIPLRYGATTEALLEGIGESELTFNYLGQLDVALGPDAPARPLPEIPGRLRAGSSPRPWLIEAAAGVLDQRLWFVWTYADGIHHRDTITSLANGTLSALRALLDDL